MHLLRPISRVWSEEWGLSALLVSLIVLIFLVYPLSPLGHGNSPGAVFFCLLLLSGVAAAGRRHRGTGRAAALLTVSWIGIEVALALVPSFGLLVAEACVAEFSLGLLMVAILIQVFRAGRITHHRIQGAVAAYLLMGLIWAWAYRLILLFQPAALIQAGAGGEELNVGSNLAFFSFITLTTVGYGDILPVHPMARSLASLEALVGQLYPVVLLGRLVSLSTSSGPESKE